MATTDPKPMQPARIRRLMASAESREALDWQELHEAGARGRQYALALADAMRGSDR